ncbi:hypothetical protein [Burkholderia metallica]|uniref:hypothetical protein n=1 Tax=Burkholderia metallica TaxID=488729 RepID=UPI00158A6A0F|nr:hypothetical protein [Burkholderia metallica]
MKNVYEVQLSQTRYYFAYIEVVADSEEEARAIAESKGFDGIDWNFGGDEGIQFEDVEFQYEQDNQEDENEQS